MPFVRHLAPFAILALGSGSAHAAPTTIFLQYEEQRLVAGEADDAPNDVSATLEWFGVDEVTMPALTTEGGQDRAQLIAAVQQMVETQWEAVDVEFVTQRPTSGDFLMVTMGGRGDVVNLGYAGGWGIVDCYDENETAVAFVFSDNLRDEDGTLSASKLAMVVSQEAAHTVGLEHLGGSEEFIMYPRSNTASQHVFSDTCEEIADPIMDPEHPEYCLDHPGCEVGFQNDLAHLIEYLGPAGPGGMDSDGTDGGDTQGDTEGSDTDPGTRAPARARTPPEEPRTTRTPRRAQGIPAMTAPPTRLRGRPRRTPVVPRTRTTAPMPRGKGTLVVPVRPARRPPTPPPSDSRFPYCWGCGAARPPPPPAPAVELDTGLPRSALAGERVAGPIDLAYASHAVSEDNGTSNTALAVAKGALMALGGLVVFGLVVSAIKPLALVALVGGGGYLGYRALSGKKRLGSGRERKALGPGSSPGDADFDRRMKELDAIERRLDREIGKY